METTNDILFMVVNQGDIVAFAQNCLYNHKQFFVVEVTESTWIKNKQLHWAYSDRILITPAFNANGKHLHQADNFLSFGDIRNADGDLAQSILNQLRRYVKKWSK